MPDTSIAENVAAAIINTLPITAHQALIDYLDNNEQHGQAQR